MRARPRLRLAPSSLSVYTVVGNGKTLYVKFLSAISVTFSGKKEGGESWRVSSFISRLLTTTRKSWHTICWTLQQRKAGLWHESKTADCRMLVENSWFDTTTDNVMLAQSWGYKWRRLFIWSTTHCVVWLRWIPSGDLLHLSHAGEQSSRGVDTGWDIDDLPSHEEPAGSWTTFTFGWLALSILVATGVIILLRVGRGFVYGHSLMMMLRSPGETLHCPSIWLSTVLGPPFILRRLVVLASIAFYRVGRRITWTTDSLPPSRTKTPWHHLLHIFHFTWVTLHRI